MSIDALSSAGQAQSYQQPVRATGRDPDGDGDNEATESAAAKAQEAAAAPALPVDTNRGRTLNVTA